MYAKKITILYTNGTKEIRVIEAKRANMLDGMTMEIDRQEGVKMVLSSRVFKKKKK